MTVAQALQKPTATVIILAEITCGVWCRAWVVDGTYTNTYKVTLGQEVESVMWNGDTDLTERASLALVDANAGSWLWDGATLWVRPVSGSIFDAVVQAFVQFWFCHPKIKILGNQPYDPRLLTAPNLSQRIEAVFGDVGQRGGGNMVLANADGYFNAMQSYQWNAGTVTLRIGVDTPAGEMSSGSYETLATWKIEDWSRNETDFTLKLAEPKGKIGTKLPLDLFNRDDFPAIEKEEVGKPVALAYGILYGRKPIVIDAANKTLKVAAAGWCRQFLRVRIKKSREEPLSTTTAAADWVLHSSDTYKYHLPGEEVRNVTSDGDSLTKQNSIADVISTNGSWYAESDYVFVNPQGGETISSETYIIASVKTADSFETANFASTDAANGEFTLGDDWIPGTEVSVDFEGKPHSNGELMANAVDIVEDILATVGETNLNAASFTEARARLKIGTDINGREFHVRKPAVYLEEAREATEIVGDILAVVGGFYYTDNLGQITVGIMEPEPGENLPRIGLEILDFEERNETRNLITKIVGRFARRDQDNYEQIHEEEREDLQIVSGQAEPNTRENELGFWEEADAEYFAQRALILEGQPLKTYTLTTPWTQFQRHPGDQVWVISERYDLDQVLEVLEVRIDLGAKRTTLTVGNLRGFEDAVGFWVADADVLPARFAPLAGYGAGSLVWNASWHPEIKLWARQNVGYWTDANGFADPADPQSFIPSCWF